jgi:carotenoid cleavage dioxygenase-like enzyme
MRFNMKTGLASQKKLSASAVDFPRVNESYTGRYLQLLVMGDFGLTIVSRSVPDCMNACSGSQWRSQTIYIGGAAKKFLTS